MSGPHQVFCREENLCGRVAEYIIFYESLIEFILICVQIFIFLDLFAR